MGKAKARQLTKEATELLLRCPNREDSELAKLVGARAFTFDDGSVLTCAEKNLLWPSRVEAVELFTRLRSSAVGRVVERGIDVDFTDQIEYWILSLASKLGLSSVNLDRTPDSLTLVDRRLQDIDGRECRPELVAYVGEVIRKEVCGEWSLLRREGGAYEPLIVAQDGRRFAPLLLVNKELDGPSCSLETAVDAELDQ